MAGPTDPWSRKGQRAEIWAAAKMEMEQFTTLLEHPTHRITEAPDHLGESVLWNDEPFQLRQYSARCASRCELVSVAREAVDEVVMANPLLYERYMAFKRTVRRFASQHELQPTGVEFLLKLAHLGWQANGPDGM